MVTSPNIILLLFRGSSGRHDGRRVCVYVCVFPCFLYVKQNMLMPVTPHEGCILRDLLFPPRCTATMTCMPTLAQCLRGWQVAD